MMSMLLFAHYLTDRQGMKLLLKKAVIFKKTLSSHRSSGKVV